MVALTGSATEKSYEQNAVVELVETSARGKSPILVALTGSTTDPPAGSKALPELVEGSIEKADGGFDKLNHQSCRKCSLRSLSLSKCPLGKSPMLVA